MAMGFRPAEGSDLVVDPAKFQEWGLDAANPPAEIDPGLLTPEVLEPSSSTWGTVKKPAIVTFVVDLSGSMDPTPGTDDDDPINQVKTGLIELLNAMAGPDSASPDSRVAVVTFNGQGDGLPMETPTIRSPASRS